MAQAATQAQAVKAGDYARDIRTVCGQKSLQSRSPMSRRFRFHPATLRALAAGDHGAQVYSVNSVRSSVRSVSHLSKLEHRLRRQPR